MERFDSPIQESSAPKRPPPRAPRLPFAVGSTTKIAPDRMAVSSALVPVLFGILLLWNWRFALALLAGSFAMNTGSAMQSPTWQNRLAWMRRQLPDGYGLTLLLTVIGGTIATLGTYTGLSMWMAGGDRWLTIGAIGRGLVSFGILCVLGMQVLLPSSNEFHNFDRSLQKIASTDPLIRLLAVQAVNQALSNRQVTPKQRQLALDCLKLALRTETEPNVRKRMLQTLDQYCACG